MVKIKTKLGILYTENNENKEVMIHFQFNNGLDYSIAIFKIEGYSSKVDLTDEGIELWEKLKPISDDIDLFFICLIDDFVKDTDFIVNKENQKDDKEEMLVIIKHLEVEHPEYKNELQELYNVYIHDKNKSDDIKQLKLEVNELKDRIENTESLIQFLLDDSNDFISCSDCEYDEMCECHKFYQSDECKSSCPFLNEEEDDCGCLNCSYCIYDKDSNLKKENVADCEKNIKELIKDVFSK